MSSNCEKSSHTSVDEPTAVEASTATEPAITSSIRNMITPAIKVEQHTVGDSPSPFPANTESTYTLASTEPDLHDALLGDVMIDSLADPLSKCRHESGPQKRKVSSLLTGFNYGNANVDNKPRSKHARISTRKTKEHSVTTAARFAKSSRSPTTTTSAKPDKGRQLSTKAEQNRAVHPESDTVPIIHPPLRRPLMEKVYAMRTFINLIDSQAGITYANIDANGTGDPTKTRVLARDFLGAMQALAADLELEDPRAITLDSVAGMAKLQEQEFGPSSRRVQWAIVDFTKSSDIERRAQAIIGNRGLDGRTLLGIQCCMQAWHQAQQIAAKMESKGFRPEFFESYITSDLAAGFATWSEAQKEGQKEVEEMLRRNEVHDTLQGKSGDALASASNAYLQHSRQWLQHRSRISVDEQILPKTVVRHPLEPCSSLKREVCPLPHADLV